MKLFCPECCKWYDLDSHFCPKCDVVVYSETECNDTLKEEILLSSDTFELPFVSSVLTMELLAACSLSAHPANEAEIIKVDIASKIG